MKLRKYQRSVAARTAKAFHKYKSVLLVLPTGAGKTFVASNLILNALSSTGNKSSSILYLVHRKELLAQTANTFKETGIGIEKFGVIAPNHSTEPGKKIQIASINALYNRAIKGKLDWLKPMIVVVDEAHHARARTWHHVLDRYRNASILGLTATPERLDGAGLGDIFDEMVVGPSPLELVAGGFLCNVDAYTIPNGINLKGIAKLAGDYKKSAQNERITNNVIVSSAETFKKMASKRKAIHYAVSVDHSKRFIEQIKKMGFCGAHIDGKTPPVERTTILRDLELGRVQVLSNVDIVTEGFDCPSVSCILLGRRTASITLCKQMVGRSMRPKADGVNALCIDLVGNFLEHGHPLKEIDWSLKTGGSINMASPQETTMLCPACGFLRKIMDDMCLVCGHVIVKESILPTEVDILLEKLDIEGNKKTVKRKPKPKRTRVELTEKVRATGGDVKKMYALAKQLGYNQKVVKIWSKVYHFDKKND